MPKPADTAPESNKDIRPDIYFRASTGRPPTDLVINHIIDGLIQGRLKPGQRLNASKLVEALGVSVVPVREAMHFLAGEGVIELLPLKGTQIRNMDASEIVDWWQIFRAISEIGLLAAAEALIKSPENAHLVTQAIEKIERAETELSDVQYILALADFHRVINTIGNKPVLDEAVRRLQVIFWCLFLPDHIPFDTYGHYFTEHYKVVGQAIMRGDGASAVSAFKHHVDWSSALIDGERPEPGAPWGALS